MSRSKTVRALAVVFAATSLLVLVAARTGAQIPTDVIVDFGPGHPQPAAPGNHVLVPNDVSILKGGTVTFRVNGGGHGIAIYPVHRKTTREDILNDLCQGGPGGPCVGATANPAFQITDGKNDVIVDIAAFAGVPFYDYPPERVIAAIGGSGLFLNGSTNPATPPPPPALPAPGVLLQHRFEKTGRFLVICMNRFHAINDYMFGFVNVVGD